LEGTVSACDTRSMNERIAPPTYAGYRFPPASSAYAVWLSFRFALRHRDVEELLEQRAEEFLGGGFVPATPDQEVEDGAVLVDGAPQVVRRAVDGHAHLVEVPLVARSRASATERVGVGLTELLAPPPDRLVGDDHPTLLKGLHYVPRVVVTDTLASDDAARREALPRVEHRRHKGLNNRAENVHQPTRERERRMRRFKSRGHAQWFLAAYGPIATHFRPRRHRLTAAVYRETRTAGFATWRAVTGTPAMA